MFKPNTEERLYRVAGFFDKWCLKGNNKVDVVENHGVKSCIFGQTAKFGQRPCLFQISNIGIKKNQLSKQ